MESATHLRLGSATTTEDIDQAGIAQPQGGCLFKLAIEYSRAEVSVIPLRLDGSKSPQASLLPKMCDVRQSRSPGFDRGTGRWKPFCYRIATSEELLRWCAKQVGIGIVCGTISGGLEVIDFDDGELFSPWYSLVASIVDRLPVVETPSGGFHVYYRCQHISGNEKIAVDPNRKKQTLIETRGEGGYIVAEGTPCETHTAGLPYCQFSGPPLPCIPRITPDERCRLWAAARTFDKRGQQFIASLQQKLVRQQYRRDIGLTGPPQHPLISAFNASTSWESILVPHGWTTRDGELWTRPGKPFGVSARIIHARDGQELLTVFSGNAGPLSPTDSYRILNKFTAYAALYFAEDFHRALQSIGGSKC